jgi:hypothetical protein
MGIARSTFYDLPIAVHDDTAIVEAIAAICDEFEFYGWRRVRAEPAASRHDRQSQEDPAADAPTRSSATPTAPLRRDN